MNTFSISSAQVQSNQTIVLTFSTNVASTITTSNFTIFAKKETLIQPTITSIFVQNDQVILTVTPLYPLSQYTVTAFSNTIKFISQDKQSILISDSILITGIISTSNNIIKQNIYAAYKNNIYDLRNDLIGKYIDNTSDQISQALYTVRQIKNEVYLSKVIVDEQKTRGDDASDRLNEESTFEIVRVGMNPTNKRLSYQIYVTDFTANWVSLQQAQTSQTITTINQNLIFTLTNQIITAQTITVVAASGNFTYNISRYGYYLLNNQYDSLSNIYYLLTNYQVGLNPNFFSDNQINLNDVISVTFNYLYKNPSIYPAPDSISVYAIRQSLREPVGAILNIVDLNHNNITDQYGKTITTGGLVISNTENPNIPHQAFIYEIPFNGNSIPSSPGQFSVDYTNGRIYCYGATANDGTGPYPPSISYFYNFTYTNNIDYTLDLDNQNIISIPFGNLRNNNCYITHQYDYILQNNIDYISNPHTEALNEGVGNGLLSINTIKTQNFPITNVFQIYNLSSGEIYNPVYWEFNKIYFSYINPPKLISVTHEISSLQQYTDDLLIPTSINAHIVKIQLQNQNIASATKDLIGSSYNSSLSFSNTSVFATELYFDSYGYTYSPAYTRLTGNGQYTVDYVNGIIYLYTNQTDLGSATYSTSNLITQNLHIVSVQKVYYNSTIATAIDYNYFEDNSIILNENFAASSEIVVDNITKLIAQTPNVYSLYAIANGFQVGYLNSISNTSVMSLKRNITKIYGFYILADLLQNANPTNFAGQCSYSGNSLAVLFNPQFTYSTVSSGLTVPLPATVSSPITLTINSVINVNTATLVSFSISGSNLVLTGITAGSVVKVIYTISFAGNNIPVISYSSGSPTADYTYLADELQVSYEYGDNVVDFSNKPIATGTKYYVTYKVGALRDTLLANFGTNINIPQIQNFDLNFNREKYRSCLTAALNAYSTGPTLVAIKNIPAQITKIAPELAESFYNSWSLGYTHLSRSDVKAMGLTYTPAIFGNGCLCDGQVITLPASSNIPTEGTFEAWLIPQWDGLDNSDILSFVITGANVYIGSNGSFSSGTFSISKSDILFGTPSMANPGVYVYYDFISKSDSVPYTYTNDTYRWFVVNTSGSTTAVTITTTNSFYAPTYLNLSSLNSKTFLPITTTFTSKKQKITLSQATASAFSFISDTKKYLLDVGQETKNRISIYKDLTGYIYFKIIDSRGLTYSVSANINSWKKGDPHFIAAAWKINTVTRQDELHLFIDGYEVPNYNTFYVYGNTLFNKFSDFSLDNQAVGVSQHKTISGSDLVTSNSTHVHTGINLTGINIGDTLVINEAWASTPYTIIGVIGNTITLNTVIPYALTNIPFVINPQTFSCNQAIFAYDRISISAAHQVGSTTGTFLLTSPNVIVTAAPVTGSIIQYVIEDNVYIRKIIHISGNSVYIDGNVYSANAYVSEVTTFSAVVELPGVEAISPYYSLGDYTVTFNNGLASGDFIFLNSYGLNNNHVSGINTITGSNVQNIMKGRFASPINMNYVTIRGILYPQQTILNNAHYLGSGLVMSGNNFSYTFPIAYTPNHILFSLIGTNLDYSVPVNISYNTAPGGLTLPSSIALHFTTGSAFTSSFAVTITPPTSSFVIYTGGSYIQTGTTSTYVTISGKVLDPTKPLFTVELKDFTGITDPTNIANPASLDYYYQIDSGTVNGYGFFNSFVSQNAVGGKIGFDLDSFATYTIVSIDNTTGEFVTVPPSGVTETAAYKIYKYSTIAGFQNGFFMLQNPDKITPYSHLVAGKYEISYLTNLYIPVNLTKSKIYFGTDINGENPINAIMDCVKISNVVYSDTRIGEAGTNYSVTADYNTSRKLQSDTNTMVLIDFGILPLTNASDYYIPQLNNQDIKIKNTNATINSNFNTAFFIDKPIVLENNGIINSVTGNIEMWIAPTSDYFNDPVAKYFLDIYSNITQDILSQNHNSVILPVPPSQVISVTVNNKDYFAGGSISGNTVYLGTNLPRNNIKVSVNYVPLQSQGNRISVYRSFSGDICFSVSSKTNTISTNDSLTTTIAAPVTWNRNTWHKLKIEYDFSQNQILMFVDGYLYGEVVQTLTSNGVNTTVYSGSVDASQSILPISKIIIEDTFNSVYIGSDYTGDNICLAMLDNIKISNKNEPIYQPFGEIIDPTYSSNLNNIVPVEADAYTTYSLCSVDVKPTLFNDFAQVQSQANGNFDFTLTIADTYNIISNDAVAKTAMVSIINALKPANSRAFIKYKN